MKTKLTITVDERLLPEAKRFAKRKGTSLSSLIEQALRAASAAEAETFAARWRGKFKAARRGDQRYRSLAKKYL